VGGANRGGEGASAYPDPTSKLDNHVPPGTYVVTRVDLNLADGVWRATLELTPVGQLDPKKRISVRVREAHADLGLALSQFQFAYREVRIEDYTVDGTVPRRSEITRVSLSEFRPGWWTNSESRK
jgi:hypothetical protein